MKKIYLMLFFIISTTSIICQQRFDPPSAYTQYYKIRMWSQSARPSADSLNKNWKDIDSLLNELVVFTNPNQMQIINDTLKFSPLMSAQDYIALNKQYDTVQVMGMRPQDIVVVTIRDTDPNSDEVLSVYVQTDRFIVARPSSSTRQLWYNWIWIKK